MTNFNKGDKIKMTFIGVVECDYSSWPHQPSSRCLEMKGRTVEVELLEKAPNPRDFESDPYGTLYVDDFSRVWVKLKVSGSTTQWYIRRTDEWDIFNPQEDGLDRLKKSSLRPKN